MNYIEECLQRAENTGPANMYLVMSSGDGSYSSDLVVGLENARKMLAKHMWFGPYEEAQKDEMVKAYLESFDDQENNWDTDGSGWHGKGEQCWFRVMLVQDYGPLGECVRDIPELCARLNRAIEVIRHHKPCDCKKLADELEAPIVHSSHSASQASTQSEEK